MINKQKSVLAYGFILFSTVSGLCAGPNLIADGGFELPVTGPGGLNSGYIAVSVGNSFGGAWTVVGSPANANIAIVPAGEYTGGSAGPIYFPPQEGNQSVDLSGELDISAAIGLQQTVPTVAGHSYTLSFYVGAITTTHWAPNNGPAAVGVLLNGNPLITAINSDPSGDMPIWKGFSTQFTASGASTTLRFMSATTGSIGFNGLDNISLVEVPEPAMGSLLAIGAATLLLGSKTARKRRS